MEGLAEKANWLGIGIDADPFGKALLDAGLSMDMIKAWSVDPRVKLPDDSHASIFDVLEDLNVQECKTKMIEISKMN